MNGIGGERVNEYLSLTCVCVRAAVALRVSTRELSSLDELFMLTNDGELSDLSLSRRLLSPSSAKSNNHDDFSASSAPRFPAVSVSFSPAAGCAVE